jgi:hypothetical protein
MSITIEEEVTVADIDEALAHINLMLKTDHYGNRLTWQKKEMLLESLDDLLDARIVLMNIESQD